MKEGKFMENKDLNKTEPNQKTEVDKSTLGLAVGISLGLLFGIILDNIGVGVLFGVAFGLCLPYFFKKAK